MPPALSASWAKEQLTGPGMHQAKASLRSWLAWWFKETDDRTVWWWRGAHLPCPGSKQLPLARGMDGELSSSLVPTPPASQKPLHGIQIKRGAMVPWKGEEVMGAVRCCRARVGYQHSKWNIMCFLSFFELFTSRSGNLQMYWKIF